MSSEGWLSNSFFVNLWFFFVCKNSLMEVFIRLYSDSSSFGSLVFQLSYYYLTHSSNHLVYFAHFLGILKIKYGLFIYSIITFYHPFTSIDLVFRVAIRYLMAHIQYKTFQLGTSYFHVIEKFEIISF